MRRLVRQAARDGAQVILLQELFETPYFCIEQDSRHLRLATAWPRAAPFAHSAIARELGVVLPVSFFERAPRVFQLVAMMMGMALCGVYRKAYIPMVLVTREDLLLPG